MQTLQLDGKWQVTAGKGPGPKLKKFTGTVPGCVHHDLEKNGLMKNPYAGERELEYQWIGEREWTYTRDFTVDPVLLGNDRIYLVCEGLDTLASVKINGKTVGTADNMFRRWDWDVKKHLKAGKNTISIRFDSTLPFISSRYKKRNLRSPNNAPHEPRGRTYIRKEQCNYGWDWGPVLITAGIWLPIRLEGVSTARIADVDIRQKHSGGKVKLDVAVNLEHWSRKKAGVEVSVSYNGKQIAAKAAAVRNKQGNVSLVINKPQLWWPAGMGEQPLYDVAVAVKDTDGTILDWTDKRIGLRTLDLVRNKDRKGETFKFRCNGKEFFAKGANWIPADGIKGRITGELIYDLLQSAVDANMNMIRVWGGGLYEYDYFYNTCDELGLCVWQDFMFACGTYPGDDPAFVANVKAEAEYQVKRLRHHPSLALWCGNNELEQNQAKKGTDLTWPVWPWKVYDRIFNKMLPSVVQKLNPATAYWPSSPHTPGKNQNDHYDPTCGDVHYWAVWHHSKPFEWYRETLPRFCSEFGFQSFPEPRTVATYAKPGDESNVTSPVMEHHQRSWVGNTQIMKYMLDWFPMPKNSEGLLWLSQIQQGLAIKYAVEHYRQNMHYARGAIIWQLNDNWPVASWSSIDYYGRWKALHYMSKRFFSPLLITGVEEPEKKRVRVHVSSDLLKKSSCVAKWRVTTTAGKKLSEGSKKVMTNPDKAAKITYVDCKDAIDSYGERAVLVWLELWQGTDLVSHNLVHFVKPKHMVIPWVDYSVMAKKIAPGGFAVKIKCDKPSLWTWMSLKKTDARFSDSFACLSPGEVYEFTAKADEDLTVEEFKKQLQVRSIRDCF